MHAAEASSRSPVRLASHVCACRIDEQVVLLDLRHSRYLSIGGEAASALASRVDDWPVQGGNDADANASRVPASSAITALTQRLTQQGLLAQGGSRARDDIRVVAGKLEEATASLDFEHPEAASSASVCRVARFMRSAVLAALWLRCRSLESIAAAVTSRQARMELANANAHRPDAVLRAAAAYERLRPFGFTAEDKCLQDSLALTNYLAAEGVMARWVIGVKTRPFGAHSWVQSGPTVLNDQPEQVRRYTPILVV